MEEESIRRWLGAWVMEERLGGEDVGRRQLGCKISR